MVSSYANRDIFNGVDVKKQQFILVSATNKLLMIGQSPEKFKSVRDRKSLRPCSD